MQIGRFRTTTKKATREAMRQTLLKATRADNTPAADELAHETNTDLRNRFASTLPKTDRVRLTRKNVALKTITINYDLASRLEAAAIDLGKPKRWIAEQAISLMTQSEAGDYTPRDLARLADNIIADVVKAQNVPPLIELVEQLQKTAQQANMMPPHPQTARKVLRKAAATLPSVLAVWSRSPPRQFTRQDDRLIEKLRAKGLSLSKISSASNRKPHIVSRRLHILATRTEEDIESGQLDPWDA